MARFPEAPCQTVRADFPHTAYRWFSHVACAPPRHRPFRANPWSSRRDRPRRHTRTGSCSSPLGEREKLAVEFSCFALGVDGSSRPCPHTYLHEPAQPKQGSFPPTAFWSPSSSVLRAPRTPSRHDALSPSAYRRRLRPTWPPRRASPVPYQAVAACRLPYPGSVLHASGSRAHSLLPSPRHDRLGHSAFRRLSHEAAKFTLSHSARSFAPLRRDPTVS